MNKFIEKIFDENSFMKIGARETENVVIGYGTVCGRLVYAFAQDDDDRKGVCDAAHLDRIIRVYNMAIKSQAPILGVFNSAGIALDGGMAVVEKLGELYRLQRGDALSVPQYMIVDGRCGGGLALAAAMGDFVFVNKDGGEYFLNAPDTLEKCDADRTAEALDFVGEADEIAEKVRLLVDMLPSNVDEGFVQTLSDDDMNRGCNVALGGEALALATAKEMADDRCFAETKAAGAKDAAGTVTGFARLGGILTGVAGFNRRGKDSRMDSAACRKYRQHVEFCDRFGIPMVSLIDIDGFKADYETEIHFSSAVKELNEILAFVEVPRVNVIIGSSLGSAHGLLNSHGLGTDYVFAWEGAKVGLMDKERYTAIYGEEMQAADLGAIDKVIYPEDTRKYLIGALDTLV